MSSLGLLEAKINSKLRTTGNYCHNCDFCGGGGGLLGCWWLSGVVVVAKRLEVVV